MIEFDLKESVQTSALGRMIDTIHSTDNIIDIFAEAIKQLSLAIKCDYVKILLNNEKAEYFYINYVLNHRDIDQGHDVIISYSETSVTEIIRHHRSLIRNDLTGRGMLTPGDKKFLAEGIKSDLSVPIISKNKVLAIINLSSYQSNYFTEKHQTQAGQIASLLALALARSELIEKLDQKRTELLFWKNKFNSLIHHTTEPIAIIRQDYDLIYETNAAFEKLTGYSSEELHGMRLSSLHPEHEELILSKLDKITTEGMVIDVEQFFILRKDGDRVPVNLRFVGLSGNKTNFIFAFYENVAKIRVITSNMEKANYLTYEEIQLQLSAINELNKLANSDSDLSDIIQSALIAMRKLINYDYAQINLIDNAGENIESYTIVSNRCREIDEQRNWNILEGCESCWFNFGSKNLRKQGRKNGADTDTIEEALRSRFSATLMTQNRYLGTLAIGNLEPNSFKENQFKFVYQIAQQSALIIENVRLTQAHKESLVYFSIQDELNEMIGINLDIKNVLFNVVRLSIQKTKAQLATVHLLERDDTLPEITISHPEMDKQEIIHFERDNVIPVILKSNEQIIIDDIIEKYSSQDDYLPSALNGYKTFGAVPLKSNDKTIGMLTIYWNRPISLNSNELYLIKAVAIHASAVIENAQRSKKKIENYDQLEKVNNELENLLYSVSHDLKTPLASIQGLSLILLDNLKQELDEEAYKYLERIRYNALKMQCLINDLLEFSRIGRRVEPFEETDIVEIIYRATNELMYVIKRKKVKLIIDKNMPKVFCERKRIEQVFVNLIDNAIKYIGEHNKNPRIRIGYTDGKGKHVFFVQDNGIGIKKEFHNHVFELFHRINDGKDDENSSGIGLAIVKKIIENHHGEIWLESEEGKGSTFFFTLPRRFSINSSCKVTDCSTNP